MLRYSVDMRRTVLIASALLGSPLLLQSQIKHTSVPLGDTLTKALALSSLVGNGSEPFHLKLTISEPENAQSPYQGTIAEWWSSEGQWRREITGPEGLKPRELGARGVRPGYRRVLPALAAQLHHRRL